MAVSKRMRFECFKRDAFKCLYCGRTPPQITLEPDHVVPISEGGPDTLDNLATSCFDCNRGKSNVPLTSVSRPLSEVMDEAIEQREQLAAYNQFLLEKRDEEIRQIEEVGVYWYDRLVSKAKRGKVVFGNVRAQSIRTFLAKLPLAEILDAVDVAHARKVATTNDDEACWKYFCGVCWTKIKRTS